MAASRNGILGRDSGQSGDASRKTPKVAARQGSGMSAGTGKRRAREGWECSVCGARLDGKPFLLVGREVACTRAACIAELLAAPGGFLHASPHASAS
jgi:hypothetical protein